MRIAVYARAGDAADVNRQRTVLVKWAQESGHLVVGEYVEDASWPDRPQFARLVADATRSPQPFDGIAFTGWSRLSRSIEEITSLRDLGLALLPIAP